MKNPPGTLASLGDGLLLGVALPRLRTRLTEREIFRMRWENINWDKGLLFNPRGSPKNPAVMYRSPSASRWHSCHVRKV
jgi:hypothetical protein